MNASPSPASSSAQAIVLERESFFARVHDLAPRVAVFDCDGTLWSGDAGSNFMLWSMETGLISREASDWLTARYQGYKAGTVSELAICGEMVQIYAGLAVAELRRAAADFFRQHIERNIFPEMQQLVADLQHDGAQIWAVSSTCDWVIEEGMRRFNIPPERILAARVACENDTATGRLLAVPTDEGKVEALRLSGVLAPDVVFGNSVHDAAMLGIARGPFAVNPSPELVRTSIEKGWPLFCPASVPPPVGLSEQSARLL